ncbi:MAG TPA: hypothetical protein VES61_08630 [Gaiellaceae bacterium]|nr:hypothetical protein [Gaiellaceae bacterium]
MGDAIRRCDRDQAAQEEVGMVPFFRTRPPPGELDLEAPWNSRLEGDSGRRARCHVGHEVVAVDVNVVGDIGAHDERHALVPLDRDPTDRARSVS